MDIYTIKLIFVVYIQMLWVIYETTNIHINYFDF